MIKSILPSSIAKKSALGAMLIGATGLSSAAVSRQVLPDKQPTAEIISKEAAEALKANTLYVKSFKPVTDTTKAVQQDVSFEYDSYGRIAGEFQFDEHGNLYSYVSYKFNDDGTPKLDIKYDQNKCIEWIKAYYYNEDNTKTEVTVFDGGSAWICDYDNDDNLIQAASYDDQGRIETKYVYTTDSKGNRVETIYDSEGNIISSDILKK